MRSSGVTFVAREGALVGVALPLGELAPKIVLVDEPALLKNELLTQPTSRSTEPFWLPLAGQQTSTPTPKLEHHLGEG